MDKHTLWIDDTSNHEVGLVMQGELALSEPEPVVETVRVLGRNGDLHIYDGTYRNRTATVDAYAYRDRRVKEAYSRIYPWLYGKQGYRKIRTDDDLDHYLMGRVLPSAAMKTRIDRMAPFTITFDCKPQRFLVSGDEAVIIKEGTNTLLNTTNYPSFPIVRAVVKWSNASGATVEINGQQIHLPRLEAIDVVAIYDCETSHLSYKTLDGNPAGYGDRYLVHDAITLEAGTNTISLSGVSEAEIVPRWWEL